MTERYKEIVNQYVEKAKKYKLVLGVIALGLILLSLNFEASDDQIEPQPLSQAEQDNQTVLLMEQKLCDLLSSVEGVGEIKVMITLSSSAEYVYASEQKKAVDQSDDSSYKEDSETNIILVDGQDGKSAIPIKINQPIVQGVAIVCEGADDIMVKSSVIDATKSVLGIGSNRISVIKMN